MSKRRGEDYSFDKTLGATLKELREGKSLTMQDVAEKLGVSKMTVSRWESGEIRMYAVSLRDYCYCLDMTLPEFINELSKRTNGNI